jgi:hypothetical protein
MHKPAVKYLVIVIPAKAGIQRYDWMPDHKSLSWTPIRDPA